MHTRRGIRLWTAINVRMTQHRNCYLLEYLKQLLPQNRFATVYNDRGVYVRCLDAISFVRLRTPEFMPLAYHGSANFLEYTYSSTTDL